MLASLTGSTSRRARGRASTTRSSATTSSRLSDTRPSFARAAWTGAGRTSRRAARQRRAESSRSRGLVGDGEPRDALARAATHGCGQALQAGAGARRGETRARPGEPRALPPAALRRTRATGPRLERAGAKGLACSSVASDADGRSASGSMPIEAPPWRPGPMGDISAGGGDQIRLARDLVRSTAAYQVAPRLTLRTLPKWPTCRKFLSSPGWTRTNNPPVKSQASRGAASRLCSELRGWDSNPQPFG